MGITTYEWNVLVAVLEKLEGGIFWFANRKCSFFLRVKKIQACPEAIVFYGTSGRCGKTYDLVIMRKFIRTALRKEDGSLEIRTKEATVIVCPARSEEITYLTA